MIIPPPAGASVSLVPKTNSNQSLKLSGHHFHNFLHCYISNQSGLLQNPSLQNFDEYNLIFVQKLLKTKFQWIDYIVAPALVSLPYSTVLCEGLPTSQLLISF